jgi:phosphonate transport system substrate-binding protein
VADAFLNMHKDPVGREILRQTSQKVGLPMDAYFIPATMADYTSYRRFYQSAPPQLR